MAQKFGDAKRRTQLWWNRSHRTADGNSINLKGRHCHKVALKATTSFPTTS